MQQELKETAQGWARYEGNNVLLDLREGETDFCERERTAGPIRTSKGSNQCWRRWLSTFPLKLRYLHFHSSKNNDQGLKITLATRGMRCRKNRKGAMRNIFMVRLEYAGKRGRGSKGERRRSNAPITEGNGGEMAEIWTEHERLLKSWRGTP
ncbi:hypothetical protein M405DRAFT_831140 [Rhizopogon salebrosus TDB-379]|nr:hypothetical protein M405DRAFT_831140 [Rhizopogon salebrosus TDB-379]